jgi:hypothetical protein
MKYFFQDTRMLTSYETTKTVATRRVCQSPTNNSNLPKTQIFFEGDVVSVSPVRDPV